MAVPVVVFDGTRLHTADAAGISTDPTAANWTDIGGGKAATEPDFIYQGSGAVSEKVGTSEGGVAADFTATVDYTSGPKVWLCKLIITNKDALNAQGSTGGILEIGSGGRRSAYDRYYVVGNDNYPIKGGWIVVPIDPNGGNQSARPGTAPTLTAIDYYGFAATFSATSKAENVALDAIDHVNNGKGLTITAGGGGDALGNFQSFIDKDEGTSANRWGVVSTVGDVMYVTGTLTIGSATETHFQGDGRVVYFTEAEFLNSTGFFGIAVDLQNASTNVDIFNVTFQSGGTAGGTVDTRPCFTITGTAGAMEIGPSVTFDTYRDIILTSAVDLNNSVLTKGLKLEQNGATINAISVSDATTGDGVAHLISDAPNLVSNCDFNFSDGHAIEFTVSGIYTFTGNTFTGYGAEGTNDAAVYNNITPTLMDSYPTSNQDTFYNVGNGVIWRAGQEFTASVGKLSSVSFYCKKIGSPTGNVYCDIYASDGGSPALPTGAILTSSEPRVASEFSSGALQIEQFNFSDGYSLSATQYFAIMQYDVGDSSNYVQFGTDNSSPTHSGNMARYTTSWASLTRDVIFYAYRDGHVVLNVTSGDTPTTRSAQAGAHITVNNAQVIEVTGVTEGTRCVIQRTSDGQELVNALAFTSDGQGAFKASSSFPYLTDTEVRVGAASSGKVVAAVAADGAVFTDETIQANDSRTGAGETMTLLPAVPVANDAYYFGHTEQFLQADLDVLTAGAGTYTVAWEYADSATTWASLPGLSDGTGNLKNAGANRVSWTTPSGWTARSITSQPGPSNLYYIRARFVSGTVTTVPVGRTMHLDVTRYRRWEDTATIVSTGLSIKATWIEDTIATF
jgi:hypothetical protein